MDVDARVAALRSVGAFENIEHWMIRSLLALETPRLVPLYATFSEIRRLPSDERNRLLDELARIADKQFNGKIEKPIVTPIYLAQRKLV
jgi:hypothetical protein